MWSDFTGLQGENFETVRLVYNSTSTMQKGANTTFG